MKRELTNQELLERYVHSVKTLLPPDKADDIAAEMSSNLQSLVEDQAMELGRELRLEEVSAILKQHGHPRVVASRYREHSYPGLIGPQIFPLYWFTLRSIFGAWLTVRVIVAVFTLMGTATLGSILLHLSRDIVLAAFFIGAGVTAVFAAWEYLELKFPQTQRWKPQDLPPVPPAIHPPIRPPQVKQARAAVQITGGIVWLIFLAMALFSPWMFWVWGGRGVFSPSASLSAMRFPLWLLALCGLSEMWLNHTRFAKAEWRPLLRVAVSLAGLSLAIHLLRSGGLLVAGPRWDPSQAKPLASLNQGLGVLFTIGCVSWALQGLYELRRFIRATGLREGRDRQMADSAS